mmetsp:Transcript_35797/g.111621  ORF Transcript_35797/g.111621 Transcript_35797/m.111621 type:complete len:161 (+) Transcript_35797:64-546(+)
MDPQLAARMAKQQAKEESGESCVRTLERPGAYAARIDPMLAERLARQQAHVSVAEASGAPSMASLARTGRPAPPGRGVADASLAERLARQREKADGGDPPLVCARGDEVLCEEEVVLGEAPSCRITSFEEQLANLWCATQCYFCSRSEMNAQVVHTTLRP